MSSASVFKSNAPEIVLLLSGITVIVMSAVTINYINKLKASCSTVDKKEYDTVMVFQSVQIVLGILVTLFSGYILSSVVAAKHKIGAFRGAADARKRVRDFLSAAGQA